MRKIALIIPMLQPYRLTFYEKLNRFNPNIEWMVFHGVKKIEDGRPAYAGKTSFKNIGLTELKYRFGPFVIRIHKGLYRKITDFNPDMIIIQSITGNLSYRKIVNWAKRKNRIIINWTCAWEPGYAKGVLLKFKNLLVSTFYRKGHFCLTYSTKAVQYVKERGIDKSKIDVCYNGIETDNMLLNENDILRKAELLAEHYALNNMITFLYVGGLIPEKRIDLLIDAFAKIRSKQESVKLLIIGDGPLKEVILEKIRQLNDNNIKYLGRIINDVDKYFAASTCFVLPGTGGLALNQAMFWRKICIVSEADGTEDDLVINNKTGYRFIKDNLESLTDAMQKVINLSKNDLEQMGNQARDIIINKSNVNHMVEVFTKTIFRFFPELEKKV
jgi:glycosyltransferase involved in cell wall biosynthesis